MTHLLLASNDNWDGPGPWWPLIPLFWLLVIGLVVFLARRNHWFRSQGMSTLADRFARGEIDEDEYQARKDVLKGKKR